ncbi:MAG: InlB B-repeat-containing protein [Oscillospiraceae bacterium]
MGADYTQNFYGQAALKLNAFTKADGVFAGWATTPDGEVAYTDGAKLNPTEAMDLYAVWTPAYTVTFAYNDGTTADTTVAIACGTAIGAGAIPQPTRTGYTFGGWFAGNTALTADTVIADDTTYTAAWTANTYTVQYLPNGGTGEMAAQTFTYDAEQALTANAFTRAGYDFRGWNTSASGSSVQYTDGAAVKNLSAENNAVVKLYAVWAGQPVQVTVYRNDGSEPTVRTGVVGYNYNYIYENGSARYNQIPDPTRTGYIFLGWFDAPEGGTEITNQTKFADATPVTLYAHWQEGITVHFDGNGYKGKISDKTVRKDAVGKNLPYLSEYSYPANKALDGWYTAKEGGERVTQDTVFTESEITLYAHWRDYQYQVEFNVRYSDKSSVTGEMATVAVPFGVDYKLPACTFQREGYKFAGWSESSYGTTVKYADQATIHRDFEDDDWGDGSEDNEIYKLYAVWTKDVFGIAFDAVAAALPADGTIRTADALTLPTSGDGYTITYTSSAPAVLAADWHGHAAGLRRADRDAHRHGYGHRRHGKGARLYAHGLFGCGRRGRGGAFAQAAQTLGKTFEPAYGEDTNAADALAALLASKGYDDVTVTVKAAAGDAKASIDADGTIHYYFDAGMSSRSSYFYATFVLSLDGASVEKEVYAHITWIWRARRPCCRRSWIASRSRPSRSRL